MIPLLWFFHVWLSMFFGIDLISSWLFYDSNPSLNDPPPQGLISDSFMPILYLCTPIFFFVGTVYTAYKRLWWWFGAYIGFGGGLWLWLAY